MLGFVVWAALSFQVRSDTFLIGLGIRFWERTTLCEGILALPALSSNVIPNFISHQDYEAATEKEPKSSVHHAAIINSFSHFTIFPDMNIPTFLSAGKSNSYIQIHTNTYKYTQMHKNTYTNLNI